MAAGKTRGKASVDAIELLIDDHERVKKLFKAFEKAEKSDDMEAMEDIITTCCAELDVHSKIEKEIFYPAVRAQADEEIEELLNEADVEHESVDALVQKLATVKLEDEMYKANFTVVMEYVQHHVKEEEKEMFPKVRKLKGLDLDELATQMRARQEELMGGYIKEAETADEDMEDEAAIVGEQGGKKSDQRSSRPQR